jgi:hypothetical protein
LGNKKGIITARLYFLNVITYNPHSVVHYSKEEGVTTFEEWLIAAREEFRNEQQQRIDAATEAVAQQLRAEQTRQQEEDKRREELKAFVAQYRELLMTANNALFDGQGEMIQHSGWGEEAEVALKYQRTEGSSEYQLIHIRITHESITVKGGGESEGSTYKNTPHARTQVERRIIVLVRKGKLEFKPPYDDPSAPYGSMSTAGL